MVLKEFTYKGHTCTIKHNALGFLCGYVEALDRKHPLLMEARDSEYEYPDLNVHGGVTYFCDRTVGFDCAHWGDLPDPFLVPESLKDRFDGQKGHIWTVEEVEQEIRSMVDQLIERRLYTKGEFRWRLRIIWEMLVWNFKCLWKEAY